MTSPEQIVPEAPGDLQFMQNVEQWPMWPFLPLKRRNPDKRHNQDFGVLFSTNFDGTQYIWYPDVRLYDTEKMMSLTEDDGEIIGVNSLHKLTDMGWIVD